VLTPSSIALHLEHLVFSKAKKWHCNHNGVRHGEPTGHEDDSEVSNPSLSPTDEDYDSFIGNSSATCADSPDREHDEYGQVSSPPSRRRVETLASPKTFGKKRRGDEDDEKARKRHRMHHDNKAAAASSSNGKDPHCHSV
jgi:hypothetical protein